MQAMYTCLQTMYLVPLGQIAELALLGSLNNWLVLQIFPVQKFTIVNNNSSVKLFHDWNV